MPRVTLLDGLNVEPGLGHVSNFPIDDLPMQRFLYLHFYQLNALA